MYVYWWKQSYISVLWLKYYILYSKYLILFQVFSEMVIQFDLKMNNLLKLVFFYQ